MPDETGNEKSALDLYYIDREGGNFKATIFFKPYFYLDVKDLRRLTEVSGHLLKKFENCVIEQIDLEDLELANHLSGKKHKFLKISFGTVQDLTDARNDLRGILAENMKNKNDNSYEEEDDYDTFLGGCNNACSPINPQPLLHPPKKVFKSTSDLATPINKYAVND